MVLQRSDSDNAITSPHKAITLLKDRSPAVSPKKEEEQDEKDLIIARLRTELEVMTEQVKAKDREIEELKE